MFLKGDLIITELSLKMTSLIIYMVTWLSHASVEKSFNMKKTENKRYNVFLKKKASIKGRNAAMYIDFRAL